MKTRLLIFFTLLSLLMACHKDDCPTETQKSSAKQITSFIFKAADNSVLDADITATVDESTKTVTATFPNATDISALLPTIGVSPKATVSPKGTTDFTDPALFTVTAEDGSSAVYTATVNVDSTITNRPPDAFILLQVANDSIDVPPAPTFSWEAPTDPDGDTVTYDIYIDKDSTAENKIAEGLNDPNFKLPDVMALSLARNYYWKVVAKDGKGGETASEVFRFKVQHLNDAQKLTQVTAFTSRSNHASIVFEGKMWVLGGLDQGNDLNDAWSSTDGAEWTFENEQPISNYSKRFFHDAVVFEDNMWVVGGLVNGSFSNSIFQSNDGKEWFAQDQSATKIFGERSEHTVTEHDGKMWVIAGGSGNGLLADVWRSETAGIDWEQSVEDAPFGPRKFHQTVSFKDRLWIIAGQDDAGDKNDIWSSSDGTTWQLETEHAQFSPRGFHKALVFDNKIWVVGGGGLNDIWYSEDGVEWIDATPAVSFPLQGSFTALFYQNKIWILGGTPEVWAIDYHFFTN